MLVHAAMFWHAANVPGASMMVRWTSSMVIFCIYFGGPAEINCLGSIKVAKNPYADFLVLGS